MFLINWQSKIINMIRIICLGGFNSSEIKIKELMIFLLPSDKDFSIYESN